MQVEDTEEEECKSIRAEQSVFYWNMFVRFVYSGPCAVHKLTKWWTDTCFYRLCSTSGILSELHQETDLTKSSASHSICVEEWRTIPRISLRAARSNPCNLHGCTCERLAIERNVIDLKASHNRNKNPTAGTKRVCMREANHTKY